MKKTKTKLMAVIVSFCSLLVLIDLLLFCLFLSGCNKKMKNYFYTESSLKRVAVKALKEKYDEEFEIYYAWPRDQTSFYVTCSPKSDMDVVFEAEVYKDGSGVRKDEYLQGVIANQIRDRLQPKLQQVFEDCYIKITITFLSPTYDYYNGVTVEDYYKMYKDDVHFYLRIFIDKNSLGYSEDRVKEEFDCLSQLFDDEIMQDAGCSCYFMDENTINECKNYFQRDSYGRNEFDDIIEDAIEFGFGFNDGTINKTFEEYKEIRKEIGSNE